MKKHLFFLFLIGTSFFSLAATIPNVWINEIHYDNNGVDSLEGYEIAGPSGTDLSCYKIYLYSGTTGGAYFTDTLSGVITNQACSFGTVWFQLPSGGMQNGPNDGIVLEYAPTSTQCGVTDQDTILQFLSYEGILTATSGRANGLTSVNIGVSETSSTTGNYSLQLSGTGTSYSSFGWASPAANTYNNVNNSQFFCPPGPVVSFALTSSSVTEGVGTFNVSVSIQNPNSNQTSVDVNVLGGGTATSGIDFTYAPITLNFPAFSTASQSITVTVVDDALSEAAENFTFQLANATNGATIGTNAQHLVSIADNDTLQLNIYPHEQTPFENIGSINVPVLLNHTSPNATSVTFHLVTSGTTATQGADFSFTDTTITWAAGTSGTIQVPVSITDDNVYEATEHVRFQLINPSNGAQFISDTFLLTILDNEPKPSGDCSNLYFSEYIEGSSNNKAIEIYNPTAVAVNLSDYRIFKSTNGGTSTGIFGLSGMLAQGAVYVIANSSADTIIKQQADTLSGFFNFTGNDALALLHLTDTIDIIGQLGIDPGTSWIVDTASTIDHTLIRSFYTYEGSNNWNNAVESWKAYGLDVFDSLGFHHTAPCGTQPPSDPATIRFITLSDTVVETDTVIPVVIEVVNPTGQTVSFAMARDDAASTATESLDYIFANRSFTNFAGTTYDTVLLTVKDELLIEPLEFAFIRIINVTGNAVVIPDSTFTLYIHDNDQLTTSFLGGGLTYTEGSGVVSVKVTLSSPVPSATSVTVSLAAGNATWGTDFQYTDTTVTFPPNSVDTQSVYVTILEDNLDESNEQINFDLINPTNGAVIGISACTLIIIDNDSTVGISDFEFDRTVTIFPNPVSDVMKLQNEKDLENVLIKDLNGQVIVNLQNVSSGQHTINLSYLSSGMYFISFIQDEKSVTKRFIID